MSVNKNQIIISNQIFLESLEKISPPREFKIPSHLFYEGHTPIVAFLIIQGEVQIVKKRTIINTISRGALIGIRELIDHKACSFGAKALAKAKISFLDKSTVLDLLSSDSYGDKIKELLTMTAP